jgi:hypothetical protein
MKNQTIMQKILPLFTSAVFVLIAVFLIGNEVAEQRYLTEYKNNTDIKAAGQFADLFAQFIELDNALTKKGFATDAEIAKLENLGQRITSGTSNTKRNLEGFISKLKQDNRWNDETDQEFSSLLGNRRIKGHLSTGGGARKILDFASQNFARLIGSGINNAIADAKENRRASFTTAKKRGRFGCALLFVGVFIAEIKSAPLTAENIDNIYDRDCGGGGAATAQ